MSKSFILLFMIFLHIVDDYYSRGILASMKQKDWWRENAPRKMYKYDYIWALIMHSFSWAFMVMLPIALMLNFNIGWEFIYWFIVNAVIHGVVDNLKANKKIINLWIDQLIHIIQILITFDVLAVM